jgi:L-iditol 2-dehydrogenase
VRAAVLESASRLTVRDVPDPVAQDCEVVVALELAGVCGSDVALFKGARPATYPLILGHEAIGRVVDSNASGFQTGTRVVVEPNIPCGTCTVCKRGKGNVCPAKRSLGLNRPGVFAERVALPAAFVHPLPPEIGPLDGVGLEPLAVAVHAFAVGGVTPGDAIAIIGCGTEGLLLTQVSVAMGARVLAVDTREDQLEVATRLGATCTAHVSAHHNFQNLIADWSPLVVFECAGSASAVDLALQAAAIGGRIVLVGLGTQPVPIVPLRFVRRGLSLIASLIYDHPGDFARTIELVRTGQVRPSAQSPALAALADAPDVLQRLTEGNSGKVLLEIGTAGCDARSDDWRKTSA